MIRKYLFALGVFFAFAGAAQADKMDVGVAMSKADFDAVRARVVARLDGDGYAAMTAQDKTAVIDALDRIGHRLAKPKLSEQDGVDTFNDQELINQITTHASAQSRMYCERDQTTGSHLTRVTCMTIARWMEREQAGQSAMRAVATNHRATCSSCIIDGANPQGL